MDNKERQLEQVAERAIQNAEKLNLAPPIFELYAALLSMSLAVMLFLLPDILQGAGGFYDTMESIMPQGAWGGAFFVGGVVSSLGMLTGNKVFRIIGLAIMSLMYGMLTGIYGMLLPNFGFILMLWITIFTFASIPLVKYTGLWQAKQKERE